MLKHILLIGMGLCPMLIFSVSPSPDSLKTYRLSTIRVVADAAESAISTIKQLKVNDADETVYEALHSSPGLHISLGTKDESNLKIRGFRKNDALILIDGRPLTSGYFGNVDLSKIILSDVQDIAVIKGPASAQFGSGSMGGVVNLISKPGDSFLKLNSTFSRNLRNTQRISSAHDFGSIAYNLSLTREDKPGFMLSDKFEPTVFENGAVRDHFRYKAWHVDTKLDLNVADLHELGLSWGYSHIPKKDIPSSIYGRDYRSYKDYYRSYASLGGDFYSSENSRVTTHLYYDAAGDTYERYRDPDHQSLDISSRMNSYNLGINPSLRIGDKLQTGFRSEYRHTERKDTGSYLEWTDNWAAVNSTYIQYGAELLHNLELSTSLGLSSIFHSRNKKPEYLPEPSVGFYWSPKHIGKLALSIGQNSSLPTMRQLFSAENGNPDLKPSRALKYEVNHNRNWGGLLNLVSDVSIYYNDVTKLIDKRFIDASTEKYQNLFDVQSYGTEASLAAQIFQHTNLEANYCYLAYSSKSDYKLSDSPPHSFDFRWSHILPYGVHLAHSVSWRGKRDSQDDMGNFHSLKAYHTQDIELARQWKHLELKLKLENLMDEDYQSEYGYPAPGRDFSLSITLQM
ncbi:MAG: TonB-dependent receptor [Candidatus Cloacimonetes bacterium]|nr:TonB-dependent receptor [Candidatus Cloacimonadota bacterium]